METFDGLQIINNGCNGYKIRINSRRLT